MTARLDAWNIRILAFGHIRKLIPNNRKRISRVWAGEHLLGLFVNENAYMTLLSEQKYASRYLCEVKRTVASIPCLLVSLAWMVAIC